MEQGSKNHVVYQSRRRPQVRMPIAIALLAVRTGEYVAPYCGTSTPRPCPIQKREAQCWAGGDVLSLPRQKIACRGDFGMTSFSLDDLLRGIHPADQILILPHNDPDPDAIASAVALRHLLLERANVTGVIAYAGVIGRAENKALIRELGHLFVRLSASHLQEPVSIALIDTQPGAGNNSLPKSIQPELVIDHHPLRQETTAVPFYDVRPDHGACSTILTQYLQAAAIEFPTSLATALFYGIKTDTMGLGRDTGPPDVEAYFYLQPRIDVEMLTRIEQAQVPAEYFRSFVRALDASRIYDGVIISYVGLMPYPDLAAEMADVLMRLQDIKWAICIGRYKEKLILAVRTRNPRGGAGKLVRKIVGEQGSAGGHSSMAGGQIPLHTGEANSLAQEAIQRALQALEIPPETEGVLLLERNA
jgi:nanoRNase/pAp phosphatase (c-di-AMP/oligoRNAs hydrolase)